MMSIEVKNVLRKGKTVSIKIVFDGNFYTVYDTKGKKTFTKKYFSMDAVRKDYDFVEEPELAL